MPADEYSVGGGGKLKLKGSKVSDGRIEKKKKKAKKNPETGSKKESEDAPSASTSQAVDEKENPLSPPPAQQDESDFGVSAGATGKTEAERKYEEMRKKRVGFTFTFPFCGFFFSIIILWIYSFLWNLSDWLFCVWDCVWCCTLFVYVVYHLALSCLVLSCLVKEERREKTRFSYDLYHSIHPNMQWTLMKYTTKILTINP